MNNFVVPLLASAAFGWIYYRLLKGTGIPVGSLLGAGTAAYVMFYPVPGRVLTGVLVLAAIGVEIDFQRRRRKFAGSEMVYEGGGIRRGLSPAKAGALFQLTDEDLFLVGLVQLLQKGFITYSMDGQGVYIQLEEEMLVGDVINPVERKQKRKQSAQQVGELLTPDEDILLELIGQHEGEPASSIPTKVWVDRLKAQTLEGVEGYKLDKTVEYYDAYITHRLNGVAVGHFSFNDYIDWMALAFVMEVLNTDPLVELVKNSRPDWLHPDEDLVSWMGQLRAELAQQN